MTEPQDDPSDPNRPRPLDYHRPQRRVAWNMGMGCLITLAVVVLLIGVVIGTCVLRR
jgi:hypothetical protein